MASIETTDKEHSIRKDSPVGDAPLSASELQAMDAYWRASNYLSVGQIYLLKNPLLKKPLKLATLNFG